jgi:H+-transporting ATPase
MHVANLRTGDIPRKLYIKRLKQNQNNPVHHKYFPTMFNKKDEQTTNNKAKLAHAIDSSEKSSDILFQELNSSTKGLSESEAKTRLTTHGRNELPQSKKNPYIRFLGYFWAPIPWMIEIALVLSAIIGRWEDFAIILTLLMMNAVVGYYQESKADNAIELLKKRLALKANVLRDGVWGEIEAEELVPGDVVRVKLGNIVPADIKLFQGDYLMLDESALTGESLPAEKGKEGLAYSGSIVRKGEMNGLVFATGQNTFFGKTTMLVGEAQTKSHFQKAILKIGDYLIIIAVCLAALIVVVSFLRHQSLTETLQFALVLLVAAIPAALPAVLSVTLAVGAVALAKKEAIVSKLAAIEEMAGVDILCSDKTGTITKNELKVAEIKVYEGATEEKVLVMAALASKEEDQDPIDNAILDEVKEKGFNESLKSFEQYDFKPFDPVIKRTEAKIKKENGLTITVSKGAPQVIAELSKLGQEQRELLDKDVNEYAQKGYRAIGVASGPEGQIKFNGLIALYDPPREDSAETIAEAKRMGVDVKMVTGDHIAIAREVSRRVGLGTDIITGDVLRSGKAEDLGERVEKAEGFAQVFPEDKYNIVESLQARGHIVGMTGDGVNDAPALKKADAGIAVAGATDAAKSAASIVLTSPGLSVIVDALKESRKIFRRMNNYAIYRISETMRVILFITLSILVFQFYPVTALMIVLLAVLNDIPIMSIAYDNVKISNSPETWDMKRLLIVATFLGVIGVISSFLILYIGLYVLHLSLLVLQSFIYLKLSVSGHLTVFVARTEGHFWSVPPARILVLAVVGTQITATLMTVFGIILPAMGWVLAGLIWVYALGFFLITDTLKVYLFRYLDRKRVGAKTSPRKNDTSPKTIS